MSSGLLWLIRNPCAARLPNSFLWTERSNTLQIFARAIISEIVRSSMISPAHLFYLTMVNRGYLIDAIIAGFGAVPHIRNATVALAHISLNYTTIFNILFLAVSSLLAQHVRCTGHVAHDGGAIRRPGSSP